MDLWFDLTFVIIAAGLVSWLSNLLKQPILTAYILTGLILSPIALNLIKPSAVLDLFAELGLALLLFLVGLQMNFKVLKHIGKPAVITGLAQLVFTTLIGFFLAKVLGFANLVSFYLGLALALSSTAIIVKLLSDAKLLHSLVGHISIGYLLVQDLVVLLALILLPQLDGAMIVFLKALLLLISTFWIGEFLINKVIFKRLVKEHELHFLLTLAWLFGVVSLFKSFNIPFEIGAFLAGLSLASSPIHYELAHRLKPLRDFFMMIFFVLIGTKFIDSFTGLVLPAIFFSLFVLIGNPLIVYPILRRLKYSTRVSFLSSLTVSQISEFSIILVSLGYKLNQLPAEVVSLVTLVALITILVSSYLIEYSEKLYRYWQKYLFRKRTVRKETKPFPLIILGVDRTGGVIVNELSLDPKDFLLIDFNPEKHRYWQAKGFQILLSDINDPESFTEIPWQKAKVVLSTIPDFDTNLYLLQRIKEINQEIKFLTVANDRLEKEKLQNAGADFVIIPQESAGKTLLEKLQTYLS